MVRFMIRYPLLTAPKLIEISEVDWTSYYNSDVYGSRGHYCSRMLHSIMSIRL